MTKPPPQSCQPCSRAFNAAMLLALLGGVVVALLIEWPRIEAIAESGEWANLLLNFNYDSTLPLLLFLMLPVAWLWPGREKILSPAPDSRVKTVLTALLLGGLSLLMSHHVSQLEIKDQKFGDLPPAYHDEYSYLLQAEAYLDGRVSYPIHETHPELFSQFHVLNETTFASRYFPATGLVIAPGLKLGRPYWGHWICGALTTIFIFLAGKELGGYRTGLFAGLCCALSPALALFSNLLLAHHPTLLGLSSFLYFYLRMWRTKSFASGMLAGVGLALAMLSRPMAAAGFALPMGVVLLANLIRPVQWTHDESAPARSTILKLNLAVGLPIIAGLLILLPINKAVTGDLFKLPYSQFQTIYTPNHVYGFDNVERGEGQRKKETFAKYDNWAENLTPESARTKVFTRLVASLRWTWGIVPLTMAGLFCLILAVEARNRWALIVLSLISIHVAHAPYWFTGIQDWHYVFESCLIWFLLLGEVTAAIWGISKTKGRPLLKYWWLGMLAAPMLTMYVSAGDFWPVARMQNEVEIVAFSRLKYQEFDRLLEQEIGDRRALVLIDHDETDLHIDYIDNDPSWDAPIIRGRVDEGRPDAERLEELKAAFPKREIWYFNAAQGSLELLE
ncbi:MAG: glycosyltransferase family 39 protein [Planctomycetaceae bacterium]|nr:glycosyltransferase family 39 protein [Planctomycetaceae bacterium]